MADRRRAGLRRQTRSLSYLISVAWNAPTARNEIKGERAILLIEGDRLRSFGASAGRPPAPNSFTELSDQRRMGRAYGAE